MGIDCHLRALEALRPVSGYLPVSCRYDVWRRLARPVEESDRVVDAFGTADRLDVGDLCVDQSNKLSWIPEGTLSPQGERLRVIRG